MDKYELKELKVLLQVMIERKKISTTDKELYYKVVEELGENESYEHIAQVMIDKGWLKRLDKDGYLGVDVNGRKRYEVNPYYILTNDGIEELRKKKKRYNQPTIHWDRVISAASFLKELLSSVIRWFT